MEGWRFVELGDVCNIIGGGTPSKENEKYYNGDIPWATVRDMNFDNLTTTQYQITQDAIANSATNIIPKFNVIIATRVGLEKVCIIQQDTAINQDLRGIVPIEKNKIDIKYLFYWFKSVSAKMIKAGRGLTVHGVNLPFVKSLLFPLPPLSVQKAIVAKLDAAFASIDIAIAAAERNAENAKQLFQSYLSSVFERGGEGWVRLRLQDLLDLGWIVSHLDGNHGSDYPRKEEFVSSGVPYISANCLDGDVLDLTKCKFLSEERASKLRKGIARNNDVLFAHNATVGPVAILNTVEEKTILGTSLTYYRCNSDLIEPEFLANYMWSSEFKNQYLSIMRQSTRNQIPITKQREFFHIIPPLETQRTLLGNLSVMLSMTNKYESRALKKLAKLTALKQSLLQQAFTGQLVDA